MKKIVLILSSAFVLAFISCKKDSNEPTDVKNLFAGDWYGAQQINGIAGEYKFSLNIGADNTVINIDSAFSNQVFPGTYTYTADSLKINYTNGTIWRLKFRNNYTGCTGTVAGFQGAVGTVNMTKK